MCRERENMKRIGFLCFLILLLFFSNAQAKPRVTCEIREVRRHHMLVTYEWQVRIDSSRKWDACGMTISFLDRKGNELFNIRQDVKLAVGRNEFKGGDICDKATWKRIDKYVTTLDCIF